jgi:hypothetical protein
MKLRKLICIILTLLLVVGFFAAGVGAKSNCKDKKCMQSLMRGMSHPGKAMSIALSAECCSDTHNVPCDFQRNRSITLPHLCITACRIENHTVAGAVVKVKYMFDGDQLSYDLKKSNVLATFQPEQIYLQNQSFIF